MTRADAFKQGVELGGVVKVFQVTQFVKHDIVLQVLWHSHQVQVEVNVPFEEQLPQLELLCLILKVLYWKPCKAASSCSLPGR